MEVIFGAPNNETWFNSATTESECKLTGPNQGPLEQMESKKRGVYVEKWGNSKQISIEDNKRQPRMKIKSSPKSRQITEKLLTTTPAESKIAAFTRLLGTADPAVRFKKRKPQKTPTPPKISKRSSKMSSVVANSQQKDVKPVRNIIEENKKNVKNMKFRSSTLRDVNSKKSDKTISYKSRKDIVLTPSNCSKTTRDSSDHAHWSNIFPTDRQTAGKNLLQQYICYEQGAQTLNVNKITDKKSSTQGSGKQEPIYDFFIDLLESVYDEDLLNANDGPSAKSSDVKFDIDDNVAQKLYTLQQNDGYTIRDEIYEPLKQEQHLADYYNNRKRLIPQMRRRRKAVNKSFPYFPPVAEERGKRKKPNLLNILKQQLSMDYNTEEPGNMYEALLTIAKKNRKQQRIYIDNPKKEPSDPGGACRFKRRNVISPSTRLTKKDHKSKEYSMNATRDKYRSDTTSDSSHSLEVVGYDYDERSHIDAEDSDSDAPKSRNIMNLNEGITTVMQYWKR